MVQRQPTHGSWAALIRAEFGDGSGQEDSERLFAAERHLEGLLAHPGWAVLAGLVARRREKLVEQLTGAAVLEQTEYVAKANSVRSFDEVMQAPEVVRYIAAEVRQRLARMIEAREGGQE